MRIKFNSIQDENNGFEVLATTNDVFTYCGKGIVSINHRQSKLLLANNVKFVRIDIGEGT